MLVLAVAVPGFAQAPEPEEAVDSDTLSVHQLGKLHGLVDTNRDGKLGLEELLSFAKQTRVGLAAKDVAELIKEMDSDGPDGKLSFEEIQAHDSQPLESMDEEERKEMEGWRAAEQLKFAAADTDGDGLLSEDEIPGLFYPELNDAVLHLTAESTLRSKDLDKDGELSLHEFWEGDVAMDENSQVYDEERTEFDLLDKDKNGKLNVEELKAWESGNHHTEGALKQLLKQADKNSDSHLTVEELTDAREAIGGSDAAYHLLEWAEHHEL
eukprot:TRINITY_DN80615_c0_g1_i1.p1 TRINITY_DN80615_c0_g1~~TRINITY_DN80615_c0_g1_i1.p1  ORF type:complete len:302 (+),score=87.79 TRINITY_DN80615_c0_g1_i1:104-907(+)